MKWKTIAIAVLLSGTAVLNAGSSGAPEPSPFPDSGAPEPSPFPDTGPFRVREQFLIGMGFLAFDPAGAEVLESGRTRIDLVRSRTNTFAQSYDLAELLESRSERGGVAFSDLRELAAQTEGAAFFVDGELQRTSIALRRGFDRGVEASITIPVMEFGGGNLDASIESFHDRFGLGQGGRTGVRRDELGVYLRTASGHEVAPQISASSGLGDIALALKKAITIGASGWILSVEGVLELPTGNQQHLTSGGGVDIGTQILFTKNFGGASFHGAVGVVHLSESSVLGTETQVLGSVMIGWEQMLGKRTSAVAQLTGSQSPFRRLEVSGLSEDAYLLNVGLKHQIASDTVAFLAVSENLFHYDSSADIGVHLGITVTH